ncbi:MAG: PLP-dependent aspartate aminotransferase family protein [Desulfatiglandales bacterium]
MKTKTRPRPMHKSTKAIHTGTLKDPVFGELSVPIFQSSTFSFSSAEEGAARFSGQKAGYIYTRLGNPTINALENSIASLENGFGGIATATGMAAVNTVFLALLDQNTHIVSTDSVYGATRMVLEREFSRFGVESSFVDTTDLNNITLALQPNTRVIWVETPANPTIGITDIQGAAEIAHKHGAILAVDNTFASPYLQRPLEHGADIVVHSLTKFINGHSDVLGGMIITKDEKLYEKVKPVLNSFGGTMDPHQAWLILRGVATLPLRIEKSQENAAKLARFLKEHHNVTWVRYPGLPEHPQYKLAQKQMDGFGAMIAFGVKNGLEGGKIVMNNVQLFTLAVSLGGVESLIEHPASMTHVSVPKHERERACILDELIRMSVGCEDFEDLREDLDQALNEIPQLVYQETKQACFA